MVLVYALVICFVIYLISRKMDDCGLYLLEGILKFISIYGAILSVALYVGFWAFILFAD